MSAADAFLALIGQAGLRPPPIPPRLVPILVELGVSKPVINEAWSLCFWTGWWGGFVVGAIVAAILFLALVASVLTLVCLVLWISNRRNGYAAMLPTDPRVAAALPDYRFGPSPGPPGRGRSP
jgi:hypothetical protein